jgi:AcrR family transcriptional regulator
VARWEPNARGRLQQAALELFAERGFDETTVEEIAGRAGLTKRTFFRHFADKREVLFDPGNDFTARFVGGLAAAPDSAAPLEAVTLTLESVAGWFHDRRDFARRRQAVIAANAELQERELVKLASVAAGLADALRDRGVEDPQASVLAETAVAVFRVAFERWVESDRDLTELVHEALDALRAVAAAG